jgi:class 3 adenylate cyclase
MSGWRPGRWSPQGVRFVEAGAVRLKGFARPVRLLEASRV